MSYRRFNATMPCPRGLAYATVATVAGVVVGEMAAVLIFAGSIDRRLDEQARATGALVVARCEFNATPQYPQTHITGVPGTGPEQRTADAFLADAQQRLDTVESERNDSAETELDSAAWRSLRRPPSGYPRYRWSQGCGIAGVAGGELHQPAAQSLRGGDVRGNRRTGHAGWIPGRDIAIDARRGHPSVAVEAPKRMWRNVTRGDRRGRERPSPDWTPSSGTHSQTRPCCCADGCDRRLMP
ncbi:hypothetical protein [Mycolicibacterium chubuense]